jgi:hypothetical protein
MRVILILAMFARGVALIVNAIASEGPRYRPRM